MKEGEEKERRLVKPRRYEYTCRAAHLLLSLLLDVFMMDLWIDKKERTVNGADRP